MHPGTRNNKFWMYLPTFWSTIGYILLLPSFPGLPLGSQLFKLLQLHFGQNAFHPVVLASATSQGQIVGPLGRPYRGIQIILDLVALFCRLLEWARSDVAYMYCSPMLCLMPLAVRVVVHAGRGSGYSAWGMEWLGCSCKWALTVFLATAVCIIWCPFWQGNQVLVHLENNCQLWILHCSQYY